MEMVAVPKSLLDQLAADLEMKALLKQREERTIPDRPMTPAEVATIVGKSKDTVERWIAKGRLKAKREGRTVLVRPTDLQQFLAR